jgi:hypothetical protein
LFLKLFEEILPCSEGDVRGAVKAVSVWELAQTSAYPPSRNERTVMIFFSSVSRDRLPWMYRRTPQMKVSYLSQSPENLGGGATRDLTAE